MSRQLYLGVDVGTASVRAGLFDASGQRAGMGTAPITIWRPAEDYVQQSSEQIWHAAGQAIREALLASDARPEEVRGIGFDATCSLVVLGAGDRPVSVSPDGAPEQNVIVWMDHRATDQAARINHGQYDVLRYVGNTISPEMQTPKLLWLREQMPETFSAATKFLDLPDYLTYRATNVDVRSLCTAVCKWTFLGHEGSDGRWDDRYFRAIGLGEFVEEGYARIGTRIRPMGERIGELSTVAACDLGLAAGTPVAVAIIDAHAGGLGLMGASDRSEPVDHDTLQRRLALIGGTSSCHMAVSLEPRMIDGVWGPYYSAMVPGLWLNEGGQSATGALIDHVINTHVRGPELAREARTTGTTVYALLNQRLESLRGTSFTAELTRELHVLPYFHGNRSPRADASLRGMISGLRLHDTVDALAILYLATIQSIALGTRHIVETMNAAGYRIDTILACGGDTKNPVFLDAHAQATGCSIELPREPEAVLLGAAILGSVAAGAYPDVLMAMQRMNALARAVSVDSDQREYYAAKYRVFHQMHEDHLAYRQLMISDAPSTKVHP